MTETCRKPRIQGQNGVAMPTIRLFGNTNSQSMHTQCTLLTRDRNVVSEASLRYQAIGNGMAVPVMRWIAQRIARIDAAFTAPPDHVPG